MIPKAAAHALARVLSGHELNGELGSLPAPFGAMAARLARAPAADRGALWEAMLTARDDGDALIGAVAAADPSGPPPEVDDGGDERDGWEPIRLGALPAAPLVTCWTSASAHTISRSDFFIRAALPQ